MPAERPTPLAFAGGQEMIDQSHALLRDGSYTAIPRDRNVTSQRLHVVQFKSVHKPGLVAMINRPPVEAAHAPAQFIEGPLGPENRLVVPIGAEGALREHNARRKREQVAAETPTENQYPQSHGQPRRRRLFSRNGNGGEHDRKHRSRTGRAAAVAFAVLSTAVLMNHNSNPAEAAEMPPAAVEFVSPKTAIAATPVEESAAPAAPDELLEPAQTEIPPDYRLVFDEGFNFGALDTRYWSTGAPWPGGQFCQGEELFTDQNVVVEDGFLKIRHTRRATPIDVCGKIRTYNSGMVQSKGKGISVMRGDIVKVRLQPAKGNGFWDSGLIMPENWPEPGCQTQEYEVDFFEHLGRNNAEYAQVTTHLRKDCNTLEHHGAPGVTVDYSQGMHEITVDMRTNQNVISINGLPLFASPPITSLQPGFLMFAGFIGGDWPGPTDASTPNTDFMIDNVAIYRRAA